MEVLSGSKLVAVVEAQFNYASAVAKVKKTLGDDSEVVWRRSSDTVARFPAFLTPTPAFACNSVT